MKTIAPLYKTQYGLYVECINHSGEACYNIPYCYVLDGGLDEECLKKAIETSVYAHPTLFTRIELNEDGEPVQTVDDCETFTINVEHTPFNIEEEKAKFVQPFKIVGDRLFRFRLLKDSKHFYILQDIHHIISDGASRKVLLADIERAYLGETVESEAMTQAEVATAEAERRETPAFEVDKKWYAETFDCGDCDSMLLPDLESDNVNTPQQSNEGLLTRTLDVDINSVDAFCTKHGIYKSTFFTSAYSYLLAKYNNEEEALFSTIHNGRADKRLAHSVAMLVKTLPVYAKFADDTTVLEFLIAGQKQMSGCRQHESYTYSDIVNDLRLQPTTTFAWHGNLFDSLTFAGKPMTATRLSNNTIETSIYLKAYIRDSRYCVEAEYNASLYSEALIAACLESYEAVVTGFLTCEKLADIEITTAAQREMLDSFNLTDADYDDTQTIVSLFRSQVKATPNNIALVYEDRQYTYKEIDELSERIAGYIVSKGYGTADSQESRLGAEDVVSVLIPRCEWMAIASLGVLKAGCAYQPLDPTYPKERLNFMMQDAGAKLLIADEQLREIVDQYKGDVLLTKDLKQLPAHNGHLPEPKPSSLFILLYTSGSTGVPKGCQLTHGNLVCFCHWYQRFYDLKPEHNVAAYASYGFDACMMDLYPALTCGATVHIIPEDIRLDLIALNDYFEANRVTHSFMTTQVGYQFATSIENHSLLHLSTGGEKLAAITPPQGYNFYNVYGPTECTIFTTIFLVGKKMKEIPIGKPLDNMRLYIVDAQGKRLPIGAAGELWISGPQVSRGYLNRAEKTAEVYIDNPFYESSGDSKDSGKYARVYRSGDIVRYLPSGDIQFVGRRDGQVKIRGFRIELKEVEAVIREFPGIKDATVQAFDMENEGAGKFIAAYIVSDKQIDIEALNNFILEEKPPYMVPAVTMQIDRIPLNQNQKVNKRALPKPEMKKETLKETNVPMNVLEQELHEMIAAIVNNTDFGITTVLGYAGLTSISAIKLAVQVNKRYGVTLDSKMLVKTGTVQSIENEILSKVLNGKWIMDNGQLAAQSSADANNSQLSARPKDACYHRDTRIVNSQLDSVPLSYAQTGVYFECMKNPVSTIYNIPYLLSYPAGIEAEKLADAVKQVVEVHPELNIHFTTEDDAIVQTLNDSVPVEVPVTEMSDEALANYKSDFVRPFNLQKPPLYRFEVIKTQSGVYLLMDVHHLIFDGGSADLLIRQINSVLEGSVIEMEDYTYFDFVNDQKNAEANSNTLKSAQQFFAEKLQNCEGASEIPSDLPKTDKQGYIGEAVCPINIEDVTRQLSVLNSPLNQRTLATGGTQEFSIFATPAHLFLAATTYVVSRYTNNRDVYLCTISSGRSNLKIADTVGMFVNTLALGLSIDDVTVSEYLQKIGETFDETLHHEDYPFARVANDFSFRPAIAYAYQVGVLSQYTVNEEPVEQELLELNVPKFKINIKIEPRGVVVQYDDSLYSERLALSLAESIVTVVKNMLAAPDAKIRKISIVSERQEKVLATLRQRATGNSKFTFFHDCISYYAKTTPDNMALIACDAEFTYREFDAATNQVANGLISRGVQPHSRVALLLPRTSRVMIAMFGTMKAGCAYIPCDPEYPTERIQHILTDSHSAYILTTGNHVKEFANAIDIEVLLSSSENCSYVAPNITPQDLAYLIYTSGSTGKPKGVMLRHESICNYLTNHPGNPHIHAVAERTHVFASVTTLSFDMSLKEFGSAFFNGKTFVLANEEQTTNPILLAELFRQTGADAFNATPSRMLSFMELPAFVEAIGQCKVIMCGGEKYADGLLPKLREAAPDASIFNTYGPTEITVSSNGKDLTNSDVISVGQPLLNYKEFIVDSDGNELPVGVVGELYIGGIGVATGYNDLPEMTAERFIEYKGVRVYKSGDYARWTEDGDVVILGRTDNQIKLRGLRIELGEVEAALTNIEGIRNVVVTIGKIKGNEHLCAYFTADRPIDITELKTELGKTLTKYMVPTAYLQLEKMPLTPNGKTDIKNLPEPMLVGSGDYTAPANDTESIFCDIFANILKLDRVGATDNFFELGGTSLAVMQVVVQAERQNHHIAYRDVFDNPTPRHLAALITGTTVPDASPSSDNEISGYDYTAINNLLQHNTLNNFRRGELGQLGNVLLTGATGYLGIHILRELIDSDAENIYCLVRGKSLEKAESRLRSLLYYYFADSFKQLFGTRLHIVLGDVTNDLVSLCGTTVAAPITTVFNCAAIVKHFSESTEIEDVNIGGAQRCVDFCINTGARLVHISTASTRGIWVGQNHDTLYNEQRLYMGQYLSINKYIYSKFIAERLILDAVALHGLHAKIMRVGNLAPRSTDGEFQVNFQTNSFMGRIRVYNMLGCCPFAMRNKRVEFSPINEVAQAIVLLAKTPDACVVFHPYNIHGQFLGDVLMGLNAVTERQREKIQGGENSSEMGNGTSETAIRFVEQEEFNEAINRAKDDPQKAKALSSLLAYQDMAHGQKTFDPARDNDYTTQVLYRLGFSFSPTSWDYVERMLTVIGGFGFFE